MLELLRTVAAGSRRRRSPVRDAVTAATEPLAFADPALNALADLADRHPRLWFPIEPPDPRRPLPARVHVWYVVTNVAAAGAVEGALAAGGELPSGRRLWFERLATALVGLGLWAMTVGAWERRRRRRGWRR